MKPDEKIKGFRSHGVDNLTPTECYKLASEGSIIIIDVREPYMTGFKKPDVGNVIYLPFSRIKSDYKLIDIQGKTVAVADTAGLKSRETVIFLTEKGYDNVFNMAGGFIEWERDGLPVVTNREYRLSGSCMCQIKARETDNNKP